MVRLLSIPQSQTVTVVITFIVSLYHTPTHLHYHKLPQGVPYLCIYLSPPIAPNRSAQIRVATLAPANLLMEPSAVLDHAAVPPVGTRSMVPHAGHPMENVTLQSIAPEIHLGVQTTTLSRTALHAVATLATATKELAPPMISSASIVSEVIFIAISP